MRAACPVCWPISRCVPEPSIRGGGVAWAGVFGISSFKTMFSSMMKTASGMTTRRAHYITQFSAFYFIVPDTAILSTNDVAPVDTDRNHVKRSCYSLYHISFIPDTCTGLCYLATSSGKDVL